MNAAWLVFLLVAGLFFEEPKRAPAPPPPECAARGAPGGARCASRAVRAVGRAVGANPRIASPVISAGITRASRRCCRPPWRCTTATGERERTK